MQSLLREHFFILARDLESIIKNLQFCFLHCENWCVLYWLSEKYNGIVILSEAIADLIRGISQLVEALLGFGSVILIGAIVLVGLMLFFGGTWRLLRITYQFITRRQNSAVKNLPLQRR